MEPGVKYKHNFLIKIIITFRIHILKDWSTPPNTFSISNWKSLTNYFRNRYIFQGVLRYWTKYKHLRKISQNSALPWLLTPNEEGKCCCFSHEDRFLKCRRRLLIDHLRKKSRRYNVNFLNHLLVKIREKWPRSTAYSLKRCSIIIIGRRI